ncbi:MAG: glycosyltransferase family 4 protein [Candidatus Cloacimonetes bacterium]|nr:glycosyltransferase family 4 protein [Candidatus Cloacimonadota bacterium]
MKILHLLAQIPGFTGSGIYLRSIIPLAASAGYEQAVICGIPRELKIVFDSSAPLTFYPVYFETAKLPFPVTGMSDVMPYPSSRYRDLSPDMLSQWQNAFQERLQQAIDEFKPDLILSHHLWLLTALARQMAPSLPLYAICHGTALRQQNFCPHFAPLILPQLKNIDLVFALNRSQKEKLSNSFAIDPGRIVISGNGYNELLFYPQQRDASRTKRFVYAGKLSYAKGLKELFSALEFLYKTDKNFRLTLCGSGAGEETSHIRQIAGQCRFPHEFKGNVTQEDLAEIFRHSDILILPSYYEGLPLVLIEALACGLRIIVNDLPGLKEWLGDKIIQSGLIDFVPLPELVNTDEPVPEKVGAYVADLSSAIKTCLSKSNQEPPVHLESLKSHSWAAVFERLQKHFPDPDND